MGLKSSCQQSWYLWWLQGRVCSLPLAASIGYWYPLAVAPSLQHLASVVLSPTSSSVVKSTTIPALRIPVIDLHGILEIVLKALCLEKVLKGINCHFGLCILLAIHFTTVILAMAFLQPPRMSKMVFCVKYLRGHLLTIGICFSVLII